MRLGGLLLYSIDKRIEHIKFQIFAEYLALTMRETWGPEELLAEEEPWNSQAQNIFYDMI